MSNEGDDSSDGGGMSLYCFWSTFSSLTWENDLAAGELPQARVTHKKAKARKGAKPSQPQKGGERRSQAQDNPWFQGMENEPAYQPPRKGPHARSSSEPPGNGHAGTETTARFTVRPDYSDDSHSRNAPSPAPSSGEGQNESKTMGRFAVTPDYVDRDVDMKEGAAADPDVMDIYDEGPAASGMKTPETAGGFVEEMPGGYDGDIDDGGDELENLDGADNSGVIPEEVHFRLHLAMGTDVENRTQDYITRTTLNEWGELFRERVKDDFDAGFGRILDMLEKQGDGPKKLLGRKPKVTALPVRRSFSKNERAVSHTLIQEMVTYKDGMVRN